MHKTQNGPNFLVDRKRPKEYPRGPNFILYCYFIGSLGQRGQFRYREMLGRADPTSPKYTILRQTITTVGIPNLNTKCFHNCTKYTIDDPITTKQFKDPKKKKKEP